LQWKAAPARAEAARKHAEIREIADGDAAYIAGLIDADGTITATRWKGGLPSPMVLFVNSNLGLIEWLASTIGAGSAHEVKTAPKRPDQNANNWNKVHRFQITGRKAQTLLQRCRPFLRIKARQADLVVWLPQRGRDFGRTAANDQRTYAEMLIREIRALNARGREPDHVLSL